MFSPVFLRTIEPSIVTSDKKSFWTSASSSSAIKIHENSSPLRFPILLCLSSFKRLFIIIVISVLPDRDISSRPIINDSYARIGRVIMRKVCRMHRITISIEMHRDGWSAKANISSWRDLRWPTTANFYDKNATCRVASSNSVGENASAFSIVSHDYNPVTHNANMFRSFFFLFLVFFFSFLYFSFFFKFSPVSVSFLFHRPWKILFLLNRRYIQRTRRIWMRRSPKNLKCQMDERSILLRRNDRSLTQTEITLHRSLPITG